MEPLQKMSLDGGTLPVTTATPPRTNNNPDNDIQPKPTANDRVTLRSCLTVLGGSLALFCSVGFLNAFGVFQQYYKANMLHDKSESDISWIGSVSIFLTYILSPIAGVMVDRLGPTPLIISGSILELLSIFMISLCKEYYQFFLAQAILFGVGVCFLTLPPVSVVSRALPAHRGLAIGTVIGGSSIGGLVWPIMLARLLNNTNLGFGWVMRIVGFTMLPLLVFASATIREPPSGDKKKPTLSTPEETSTEEELNSDIPTTQPKKKVLSSITPILKSKVFLLLSLGLAIAYLGMFIPFFYIVSYATSPSPTSPHLTSQLAFYLAAIVNAASLFGRIIPGYIADRYLGHFNLLFLSVFLSGIIGFCWTPATSLGGVVVWSLAFGFTSGTILSLQSACAAKIAQPGRQGTSLGMLMGMMSLTSLVGGPIGGSLVANYGYLGLSMFTGASMLAGSVLVAAARFGYNGILFAAV